MTKKNSSLSVDDINKKLAQNHCKSICLEYKSQSENAIFTCEKCGNSFPRLYSNVLRSIRNKKEVLCRNCGKKPNWNIKNIQEICNKHNLKLNSLEYKSVYKPLEWTCSCGNVFTRSWGHVYHKNRYLCPKCVDAVGTEWDIDLVREKSKEIGIILLSNSYINQYEKLQWICPKCNEIFSKSWVDILRRNCLCKSCNKKTPWNIDSVRSESLKLGTKCLSNTYVNHKTKMLFECKCGKTFKRAWIKVVSNGSIYCTDCTLKQKESRIATYTKNLCKKTFNDTICEAKLIKNPKTGSWLFYDVFFSYNGIKYIIEVHGGQHYDIRNGFNRNEEDFLNLKYRDKIKKEWALNNKHTFIEIDIRKVKEIDVDELIKWILEGENVSKYKQFNKAGAREFIKISKSIG